MPYIGKDPGTGLRGRFIYTATAGQTSFTGADSLGRTLTYTDSEYTDVYLNGVKLDKTDYTATSGTSIVLDSGASAGDILEILAFDTFGLFSGEFAQDVTVAGALTVSGTTTTAATTMTGDLSLADKIVHTGDTNTAIRFPAADTVTIETGGSERLRVNSSGKVGIGDTSPTSKLDLGSDVGSSVTDVTNHIGLFGSLYGFGVTSNQLNYVSGDAHVFYNTAGNERVRILGTGGLTFNGDTAAANALDDYEEGTFTPTYTAASSNPTVGYSNQIGRYVKIGQLVHCSIRITTSSVSGGSGALFISGLPFVAESVSNMYSTFSIAYSATWNSDVAPQTGFAIQGGTTIQLLRNSGNISYTPIATGISVSNMVGEGNDIIGAITYRTSA